MGNPSFKLGLTESKNSTVFSNFLLQDHQEEFSKIKAEMRIHLSKINIDFFNWSNSMDVAKKGTHALLVRTINEMGNEILIFKTADSGWTARGNPSITNTIYNEFVGMIKEHLKSFN